MAAGPNQTGSILQSPVSAALGYGNGVMAQMSEEEQERRRKAMQAAGATASSPSSLLRSMFGY